MVLYPPERPFGPLGGLRSDFEPGVSGPPSPLAGLQVTARREGPPEPKTRALSDDEVKRLIAAAPEDGCLLVRFIAETGCRIGEAVALQWQDLDLEGGSVSIVRAIRKGRVKG